MTFFFALHLILSSYFDVVDTRTRPSNVVNTRYSASPSNFPRGTSLIINQPFEINLLILSDNDLKLQAL